MILGRGPSAALSRATAGRDVGRPDPTVTVSKPAGGPDQVVDGWVGSEKTRNLVRPRRPLVKGLYERGMDWEDVRHLLRFIDWIMELLEPLERAFQREAEAIRQEKHMPFMDIFERTALEKGLLQGIEVALDLKFGAAGLELMPELRQIQDHVLLGKVLARIKTAASPDDLRRFWTRKRRTKAAKSERSGQGQRRDAAGQWGEHRTRVARRAAASAAGPHAAPTGPVAKPSGGPDRVADGWVGSEKPTTWPDPDVLGLNPTSLPCAFLERLFCGKFPQGKVIRPEARHAPD
jgi:hypothetical protein